MEKQLYLIPVGIAPPSETPLYTGVSPTLLARLQIIFAENIRTARRSLRQAGFTGGLDHQHWVELSPETPLETLLEAVGMISSEAPGGILSEAGMPGVADPGAAVVALAHQYGIRVIPVPGPSSIILALAASGLDGQRFSFHGYLPVQQKERERHLKHLEQTILQTGYTQIFMETPYRNRQMLDSILKACRSDLMLCVAADITGEREMIKTQPLSAWKSSRVNIHKIPALFLMNR